jgi:hypothetical protein
MTRPLQSVLMSGGQGDAVMGACGLHALLALRIDVLAPDAVVYARSVAAPLVATLLDGVAVRSLRGATRPPKPRYYTSAGTSWSTVRHNWFGADWHVNFAESRRRASTGYPAPAAAARLQHWLTDAKLYGRFAWRRTGPAYYGLQMWAPLAARFGATQIDLARGLYRSYPVLRERLRATALTAEPPPEGIPPIAVFPVGRSFQTLSPEFAAALLAGRDDSEYALCFAPGDAMIDSYRAAGLRCIETPTLDAMLAVIAASRVVATVDSFGSHIAQLAASRHVALMSHDLPVHTVHPAAPSEIVFEAMPCVPCHYVNRDVQPLCMAGLEWCGVFASPGYLAAARGAIDCALVAA